MFIRCTIEKLTNITGDIVVSGRYSMDVMFFPDKNLNEFRWSPWSNEIKTEGFLFFFIYLLLLIFLLAFGKVMLVTKNKNMKLNIVLN